MNSSTSPALPPRTRQMMAAFAALLTALVLGLAAPALAAGSGHGPDHSQGNAGTSGSYDQPQPLSNADRNSGGANGQCPGGPYCSTRDGSASQNGRGDTNGNAQAKGKPCAGCVGKADNKNPHGQMPNGSDHNAGYECDRNQGIGQSNPAHTGCTSGSTGSTSGSTGGTGGGTTSGGTTAPPACTGSMNGANQGSAHCNHDTTPPTCTGPMNGANQGSAHCNHDTTPPTCTGSMNGANHAPGCAPTSGGTTGGTTSGTTGGTTGGTSGTTTDSTTGGNTLAPGGPLTPVLVSSPTGATPAGAVSGQGASAPTAATVGPRSGAVAAETVSAPPAVLPNTGAPAHSLLILLGALAMLGGGAWVVRRQLV